MERERTNALTGIKGISAIIIACFYHYRNDFANYIHGVYPFENTPIISFWLKNGLLLVELFFIISGFIYAVAYEDKISEYKYKFNDFISNRIVRIYPLMIISTISMALLEYIYYYLNKDWWLINSDIWHLFIAVLGFSVGWFENAYSVNAPVWYISVLFQCYILAFFLSRIAYKMKSSWIYSLPIFCGLSINYSKVDFGFFG